MLLVRTTADKKYLRYVFDLEPLRSYYFGTKPISYICSLMQYEGTGSLYYLLKEKQLVESIDCNFDSSMANTLSVFTFTLYLTQEGLEKFRTISELVFSYLKMTAE